MASSIEDDFEFEEYDDSKELYGVRDGTLFIIDATPPMFENDPHEEIPYFLQCIRQCEEILKQKLVWNRQDWMGFILFGTEKCDSDSETEHILTLHKLNVISMDCLKELMKIDEGKWEYYKKIASPMAYPLHDVLWHAARAFSAVNITMALKRVILFTCRDNPPITDDNEKHRIRAKATSYSDIGLELFVVGLGKTWNHNLFYQDLEMLSRQIEVDDYKRTSLKDLIEQVKLPSRNMAKFCWRFDENVNIDVSVCNLSVKTQYLKKENMSKETNAPLTTSTYLKVYKYDEDDSDEEDQDDKRPSSPVLEVDIKKYQTFGGRNIYFTLAEVRTMCTIREPGIDLICIKPISYHLLYHFEVPYFVIPRNSNRKDNKLLFAALLNKCDSRNLMIICAVTVRKHSAPGLYTMIPNAKNGGFYLYKIPFQENVRKLSEYFSDYIYDNERKPSTNPNEIELLEKIIKKLNIEYDPKLFPNPKLQVQLQTVETLALNLEQRKPPPDNTLPKVDEMRELVKDLLDEYDKVFNDEEEEDNISDVHRSRKRAKKVNDVTEPAALEDERKIRELVKKGKIETLTVSHLRTILKTLCLKTSGKKDELINRITEHYK